MGDPLEGVVPRSTDQSPKATKAWAKLREHAKLRDVMTMLIDDLVVESDRAEDEGQAADSDEIVAARELIGMALARFPKEL